MTTTKGLVLTALLIALAGIALGFVGIASPIGFGVIFTLGALSVLGLIVASFIADSVAA